MVVVVIMKCEVVRQAELQVVVVVVIMQVSEQLI